jgi:hypothetical protein
MLNHAFMESDAPKRINRILLLLLVLSLIGNAAWWWSKNPAPKAVERPTEPVINLDADNFDFSNTGLSDAAWKLDDPPLPGTPAPPLKATEDPLEGISLLAPENLPSADRKKIQNAPLYESKSSP